MKIIHAVCDENGGSRGGQLGDQTGKEIREAKWYDRPWEQYLECTDEFLSNRAVTIATATCNGNYGYNRDARWTGYDSICSSTIESGCGDFDCSSLVLSCYRLAGLNIREKYGSTRDLAKILCATGKFVLHTDSLHLTDPEYALKGSLYCTPGSHVAMCINDGSKSSRQEKPSSDMVRVIGNSVRVRETPKTGKTIATAHKGDLLETFGSDPESGWYKTSTGYITNNTRYVESI